MLSWASISRHESFGSYGYDLGIFDQALWLLGHGLDPFSTIRGRQLFADHFQPALALLAPLGTFGATPVGLLILQAALLGLAAPFLYHLARIRGAAAPLAAAVGVMWLASPLTQWANLFDYHPETAVPLLLAAGAVLLERNRTGWFLATALLASGLKEDVCLVYAMWGLLLLLDRERRRFGVVLAAGGLAWFVLATQVGIPALGGNLDYYSQRFGGERGSSLGAVLSYLLHHPLASAGDLATRPNAKIVIALFACSGGLALLAPRLLLLAVPGLAANLLSAYPYQHELHFQYQLVPAMAFALAGASGAAVATRRFRPQLVRAGAYVLLAGSAVAALLAPSMHELFRERPHVDAKRRALELIPPKASVAAAADLVPHLAHRREIYQLPEPFFTRPDNGEYWSDAELARRRRGVEFVVIDLDDVDPYPKLQIRSLPPRLRREGFAQIFRDGEIRVFRRVAGR